MQIKATLKPGQNGTKRFLDQYGDQLVCVRYRYDEERRKRVTTVELAVDEKEWVPGTLIPKDSRVFVRVGYGEAELPERPGIFDALAFLYVETPSNCSYNQ